MAFATKYKTTIENWDGDTITAEIQEDGFSGTVQEFDAVGGSPITIEHQTNTNKKESYIIPSRANVELYINYDWDLVELLYATDRQFKLKIQNQSNTQILFVGWVISGINSEEYYTGRYQVNIQATDGLADLKSEPFLNDSGQLYDDFIKPLNIIYNCISKTGLVLDLIENTDIYATSGMSTSAASASPLAQSYIHTKSYGNTIENVKSCWEVLEDICQAFHSRLCSTGIDISINPDNVYLLSKINKLGTTATYRTFVKGAGDYYLDTVDSADTIAPLLTMGTDINHVGGRADISIVQAYKEVILKAKRGKNYQILKGSNFEDADFPTSSTLTNWTSINQTDLTGTWGGATIAKETKDGETVANLNSYAATPTVGVATQSGANVTINKAVHGLTTSDWIMINDSDDYIGVFKVASVTDANNFKINATYVSDQNVGYTPCTAGVGIETNFEFPLGNDVPLLANDDDRLVLEVEYYYEPNGTHDGDNPYKSIAIILHARVGPGTPITVDNNGNWQSVGTTLAYPIILKINTTSKAKINYKAEISMSTDNGFFSSGDPTMHLAIITGPRQALYTSDYMFSKIKLSMVGVDKESTTVINSDYVNPLNLDFHHTDGDGNFNDEYRYINSIYDDASPKEFINSWKEDGGTADNIEDLITSNLADAYDENSQVWSGTLKGDMTILNAVKDPLNFDRVFQIQRIRKNLVDNFNSVSMIEIIPGGEPTFSLSISGTSEVEFTKTDPNPAVVQPNHYATITNTGNAQVVLSATITGDDSSYFSIVNGSEFTIDVGKSHVIEISRLKNQAQGVYVSSIVVAEVRPHMTMTSKTIKLAHINKPLTINIINNVTDAAVIATLAGSTIVRNETGSTPNPTSQVVETMLGNNIDTTWFLQVSSIGVGTATMQLKIGTTIIGSETINSSTNPVTFKANDYLYAAAQAGTWNGEQLTFAIV